MRVTLTCNHVASIVFVSIHVPRNSHSDWLSGVWVHHCGDEHCTQQSLTIVVPGRIHALMMASNVSAERSETGARQVSPITLYTNKNPRCHTQPATITLLPAEAAIIYFHNFAKLPLPTNTKKAVKNKSKWSSTLSCGRTLTRVNTQFRTTLEGWRMAPYLEEEHGQ